MFLRSLLPSRRMLLLTVILATLVFAPAAVADPSPSTPTSQPTLTSEPVPTPTTSSDGPTPTSGAQSSEPVPLSTPPGTEDPKATSPDGNSTTNASTPDFDKIDHSIYNLFTAHTLPFPELPTDGPPEETMPGEMPDSTREQPKIDATCTAFTVTPTILATAAHCVNPQYIDGLHEYLKQFAPGNTMLDISREVQIRQGETENSKVPYAVTVSVLYQGAPDTADIALLQIDGIEFSSYLPLSKQNVQTGDTIYAVGFPGINLELSDGVNKGSETDNKSLAETFEHSRARPSHFKMDVSGSQTQGGVGYDEGDEPYQQGQSGGPVLNQQGEVVGIVSSSAGIQLFGGSIMSSPSFFVKRVDLLRVLQMHHILDDEGNVIGESQTSDGNTDTAPDTDRPDIQSGRSPQSSTPAVPGTPSASATPTPGPNAEPVTDANVNNTTASQATEIDDRLGPWLALAIMSTLLLLIGILAASIIAVRLLRQKNERPPLYYREDPTAPQDRVHDQPRETDGPPRH